MEFVIVMQEFAEPLLAKSIPKGEKAIPTYARLVPHLRAVERAAESIVEAVGERILEHLGLDKGIWMSRLRKATTVAALLHDTGKANVPFQKMVRGESIDQPVRHELISAMVLTDRQNPITQFALDRLRIDGISEEDLDLLLCCVIGAVAGHHLKMDDDWKKAARGLSGGCGTNVEFLLLHPDLTVLLKNPANGKYRTTYSLVRGTPDCLEDDKHAFRRESNSWIMRLNASKEWWRFAAVVKALVAAADVVGSAILPEGGKTNIHEWVQRNLSRTLEIDLLNDIVEAKLRGSTKREFQERVEGSNSRVTLVEAGCGTGKTLAAYLWATKHAINKKLYFCYPTTGTATEGFLGYVHETTQEGALIHSRACVDLEDMTTVSDEEEDERLLRVESLNQWRPKVVVCTADTVLGLVRNHRRALYNSPALLTASFVFDELHSYDTTMFGSLLALMEALPGAHFLLMSASLPTERRELLRQRVPASDLNEIPTEKSLEEIDRYNLRQAASLDDALSASIDAYKNKKRILWICNTVKRAQKIAMTLKGLQLNTVCYHSHFKYSDRVKHHRDLVNAFKQRSTDRGIVAVTTQVAEMSLDIDADLLITDWAPVPALIQRLGRLNRYVTPEKPGIPRDAYFVDPTKSCEWAPKAVPPYPYSSSELQLGKTWIETLAARGLPLSQVALSEEFNRSARPELRPIRTRAGWLDSGWFATPEDSRDTGVSVSVILQEDTEDCKNARERIKRAIPMSYSDKMRNWRFFKGALIAPTGSIKYSSDIGAQLGEV